jgi:alginate O-acetyltransferase complex protein AlgI
MNYFDFGYFLYLFVVLFFFWLSKNKLIKKIIIVLGSFLYICLFDFNAGILVALLTVTTYFSAFLIAKNKNKQFWSFLSISLLVLVLFFIKYIGILKHLNKNFISFLKLLPNFSFESLLVPLGISYLVLKYLSYVIEVYWGSVRRGSILDLFCYGSFFCIFVAGPIERFDRFLDQIENIAEKINSRNIEIGIFRILSGLVKKFVFADWIAFYLQIIYEHPALFSEKTKIISLGLYSLQIFFDFSGYSDIAIGSARLFGIEILENFNFPFIARDFSQFWKRWHISLSSWIQDYIFFPLMRLTNNKVWQILAIPLIAMILCGIWHDAKLNFILWGIFHGVLISIYQIWNLKKRKNRKLFKISNDNWFISIECSLTFSLISLGWVLFNNTSQLYSETLRNNILFVLILILLLSFVYFIILKFVRNYAIQLIRYLSSFSILRYSFYLLLFIFYKFIGLSFNTFIYMGF